MTLGQMFTLIAVMYFVRGTSGDRAFKMGCGFGIPACIFTILEAMAKMQ